MSAIGSPRYDSFMPYGAAGSYSYPASNHSLGSSPCPPCTKTEYTMISQPVVNLVEKSGFIKVVSSNQFSIEARIKDAVDQVRVGNEAYILHRDPSCDLGSKDPKIYEAMGPCCINTIGETNMRECSCEDFDRMSESGNAFRQAYEDAVIGKVKTKIAEQLLDYYEFQFTLTSFGTGFVGSEFFLMTRLLNSLEGKKGHFVLNLIDKRYAEPSPALHAAVSDLYQSLSYACGKDITFSLRLFASDQDYIDVCKQDSSKKSHLVITSDFNLDESGTLLTVFKNLSDKTSRRESLLDRVALFSRKHGQAEAIGFDLPTKIFRECVVDLPLSTPTPAPAEPKTPTTFTAQKPKEKDNTGFYILLGIVALALGGIYMWHASSKKKKNKGYQY